MRYHFEKPELFTQQYGQFYICDHPIYNSCTLYTIDGKGMAVIQQRIDRKSKYTFWGAIDPWLIDAIYISPGFKAFFDSRAKEADEKGLYPTVTVRQLMWALKMKPIEKHRWETVFDRRDI